MVRPFRKNGRKHYGKSFTRQRHGISRLPDVEGDKPAKEMFKTCSIGYFHIDIAALQTAEGELYLYVAIDHTSKFTFV